MYIIDKDNNRINKISSCTFHQLGFSERNHLQEWIAQNPKCLCTGDNDDLLIIQKEFDGFNDTNERLDLLAIDKKGALVIIENKLDDTGKNVNWQALKYVSYCSTLTTDQIKDIFQSYLDKYENGKNAEEIIVDFFDGKPFEEIKLNELDQRMILVAGKFRKEVTSTAMWMLEHNLKIQCFKATPYKYNNDIFLDIEQIIPVKETEEYIIKMADRNRDIDTKTIKNNEIGNMRKEFWQRLLNEYKKYDRNFDNVNASTDHWLSCGAGVSGCLFTFCMTNSYAGVELGINTASQEQNKKIFDALESNKENIENVFGGLLTWQRLDDKKMSRIILKLENVSIKNIDDWDKAVAFLCLNMKKLIKALKEPLKKAAHK